MKVSKVKRIVFIIAGSILITFVVASIIKYRMISKKGVYVVAVIEKVTRNKSGSSVHIRYYYKDKEYLTSFMPGYDFNQRIGRKILIKLLPNKPNYYDYLDINVPDCALTGDWKKGWSKIPSCP